MANYQMPGECPEQSCLTAILSSTTVISESKLAQIPAEEVLEKWV